MNIKKIFCSMLLGVSNILLLSLIPSLITGIIGYVLNFFLEFIFGNITGVYAFFTFIPSIILSIYIIYKLFNKLFEDTKMFESAFYAILILLFWFLSFGIIMRYFNPVNFLWVFGIFVILSFLIDFIYVFILNIIFMVKSFKNDKKIFYLILGIGIQIFIPILYILLLNGFFVKPYTDDELLKDFVKTMNVNKVNIVKVQNASCDVDGYETIKTFTVGGYSLDDSKYENIICYKGAKLYTVKANNKYYKVGSFVGTKYLFPTKQYEILDEYTTIEYELEMKKNEILKEIEQIAKSYGYTKNGNFIDLDKSDIFITKVIMRLEEYENIIMVNWLQYSNEIDIRFSNYKDKITINLDWYIEDNN